MPIAPKFGEGEEYELGGGTELVHSEPKSLDWRRRQFKLMGYNDADARELARWRSADLAEMRRWLANGCSLETAYAIVAPVDVIPPPEEAG